MNSLVLFTWQMPLQIGENFLQKTQTTEKEITELIRYNFLR